MSPRKSRIVSSFRGSIKKNFVILLLHPIIPDSIPSAVESVSRLKIEGKAVLTATNHFVPNLPSFQRSPFVRTPMLHGIQQASRSQDKRFVAVGKFGDEISLFIEIGNTADRYQVFFHGFA
jgi:hypothetical protein